MEGKATVGHFRFDTIKPIGKGGSSLVFLGQDIETDLLVAIKQIDMSIMREQGLETRVAEELAIVSKLDHPNVVKIFGVYVSGSPRAVVHIVMEYCSGGDLAHFLKAGPMKESKVQYYMKQLATGLKYLRDRSIVHRDLKPANLLLTENNRILKIADFGFARILEEDKMTQTFCGSPYYMAPEILSTGPYNITADLWSVGIILYECIYSKRPFEGARNRDDLFQIIQTKPIVYPSHLHVSPSCLDLMTNLLHRNPLIRLSWEQFFDHPWLSEGPDRIVSCSLPTYPDKAKHGLEQRVVTSGSRLIRAGPPPAVSPLRPVPASSPRLLVRPSSLADSAHSVHSSNPARPGLADSHSSNLSESSFTSMDGSNSFTLTLSVGNNRSNPVNITLPSNQPLNISFSPAMVTDYQPASSPLAAESDYYVRSRVNQSPERRPRSESRPPEPLADSYSSIITSMVSSALSPFSIFGKKP